MTRKLFMALVLAIVLLGGVSSLWTQPGQAGGGAQPSMLAPPGDAVGIGALGRIEPRSRVRKLNQAGGMNVSRLGAMLVKEGDRVLAGQTLAEFSDAPQKDAAVAQAEATLLQSEASLARIRAAGRPEDVKAQQEHVDALRAAESSLSRDAARSDVLGPSGAAAQSTVDRNRFAAIRAKSDRAEAEATLAKLRAPWPADIAVAEAERAGAIAALSKARADANLSRVFAPIDGTVLKIYARPGDQVGGDGVLEMADLDQLDVVADVYETDLPRLRQGAEADIVVPGDTRRYAATVSEIGWMVRRTTQASTDPVAATDARTVEVRLALDQEGRAAFTRRINMQVQVAIRR